MDIPNIREPVKECCGTQLGTYYPCNAKLIVWGEEIHFIGTFVPYGEKQNG